MSPQIIWHLPPSSIQLRRNEIHVWCSDLGQPEDCEGAIERTLSREERRHAQALEPGTFRNRFIAGRGLLRLVLSRYTDSRPERIRFTYDQSGKPHLSGTPDIDFSVAHSDSLALFAISQQRPIGVDIEQLRTIEQAPLLASHFFSPRENAELRALPSHQQGEAFLRCWTRKEAYLKAMGSRDSDRAKSIEVSLGSPAQLLKIPAQHGSAAEWVLNALTPALGFVAAVATRGPAMSLACWRWPTAPAKEPPVRHGSN